MHIQYNYNNIYMHIQNTVTFSFFFPLSWKSYWECTEVCSAERALAGGRQYLCGRYREFRWVLTIALIAPSEHASGVISVYTLKTLERALPFIKSPGANKIIRYRANNNDFVSSWRDYILNLMMYFHPH